MVVEERDGGFTLLTGWRTPGRTSSPLWPALDDQFARSADDPAVKADGARLQEVLRLRKENFDATPADAATDGSWCPGRSWAAWSRALGLLLPPLRVADLGCGEGYLTIEASRWAADVIGVDRSAAVLARARALGRRRRRPRTSPGGAASSRSLPIDDESVDVALLSQALHHAADPARAIAEAARIAVPGGRVLILDLREHQEEWVRAKLGDRGLGFKQERARRSCCCAAGLEQPRTRVGSSRAGDPFAVLIAAASKPAAARAGASPTQEEAFMTTMTTSIDHTSITTGDRRRPASSAEDPRAAHRHHRRRDGHDHPHLRDDGSGHPRRALQGLEEGSAEQRRSVLADAAGDDLRHPPPLPRGRRRHHRDQHVRRDQHHAERVLRRRSARARRPQGSGVLPAHHRRPVPAAPRLGDQRAVGAAVPRVGRPRGQRRRRGRASWPARSARSPCRSRTRPTPTTRASASSRSIR